MRRRVGRRVPDPATTRGTGTTVMVLRLPSRLATTACNEHRPADQRDRGVPHQAGDGAARCRQRVCGHLRVTTLPRYRVALARSARLPRRHGRLPGNRCARGWSWRCRCCRRTRSRCCGPAVPAPARLGSCCRPCRRSPHKAGRSRRHLRCRSPTPNRLACCRRDRRCWPLSRCRRRSTAVAAASGRQRWRSCHGTGGCCSARARRGCHRWRCPGRSRVRPLPGSAIAAPACHGDRDGEEPDDGSESRAHRVRLRLFASSMAEFLLPRPRPASVRPPRARTVSEAANRRSGHFAPRVRTPLRSVRTWRPPLPITTRSSGRMGRWTRPRPSGRKPGHAAGAGARCACRSVAARSSSSVSSPPDVFANGDEVEGGRPADRLLVATRPLTLAAGRAASPSLWADPGTPRRTLGARRPVDRGRATPLSAWWRSGCGGRGAPGRGARARR